MNPMPTKAQLKALPGLYETESTPTEEKMVYLHFFCCMGGDWWITEFDPQRQEFFGFANLGDATNAEWGYISFTELKALKVGPLQIEIETDRHFTPQPFGQINHPSLEGMLV